MTRRFSLIEIEAAVFVFDLDDTLYLERDFALSGFRAVADHFGDEIGGSRFAVESEKLLSEGTRGNIFDLALSRSNIEPDPVLISKLVEVYRSHQPDIQLCSDAERLLDRMPKAKTGIITDGFEHTQLSKIRALGLDPLIDHIVATGQWGKAFFKPHPRAYELQEAITGSSASQLVYIADNGVKDFVTPRKMGWKTVQILRDGRVHSGLASGPEYEADFTISSFDDISPRALV